MGNHNLEMEIIAWAEVDPDLYDGETCDQVTHRWNGYWVGDGDNDYIDELQLDSKQFPPGTILEIKVPVCPLCESPLDYYPIAGKKYFCSDGCEFDWEAWVDGVYS